MKSSLVPWKSLFCLYCCILEVYRLTLKALALIRCLSSSITSLNPFSFSLYRFRNSSFSFVCFLVQHPLNQSLILLRSFLNLLMSFSMRLFQYGSFSTLGYSLLLTSQQQVMLLHGSNPKSFERMCCDYIQMNMTSMEKVRVSSLRPSALFL